jgi:hypothetical protein
MKKVALTLAIAFASYLTVNAQSDTTQQGTSNTNTEQQSTTDIQQDEQQQQQGMGAASESELNSESSAKLEELPAEVRSAFMSSEYSDLEVTEVERKEENYVIKGMKEEKEVELEITPEGKLIDKKKEGEE